MFELLEGPEIVTIMPAPGPRQPTPCFAIDTQIIPSSGTTSFCRVLFLCWLPTVLLSPSHGPDRSELGRLDRGGASRHLNYILRRAQVSRDQLRNEALQLLQDLIHFLKLQWQQAPSVHSFIAVPAGCSKSRMHWILACDTPPVGLQRTSNDCVVFQTELAISLS